MCFTSCASAQSVGGGSRQRVYVQNCLSLSEICRNGPLKERYGGGGNTVDLRNSLDSPYSLAVLAGELGETGEATHCRNHWCCQQPLTMSAPRVRTHILSVFGDNRTLCPRWQMNQIRVLDREGIRIVPADNKDSFLFIPAVFLSPLSLATHNWTIQSENYLIVS